MKFKRSALDVGKISIAQGRGFPDGEFGREIGGVSETEHNKVVITR